jgi:CubicO group peptidase (beta-lactamase class C family)
MILIKIILGLILLAVVVFVALVCYTIHRRHAYEEMIDTHDLQAQVNRLASAYVMPRPQVALVVAVTQQGKRYVVGLGNVSAQNSAPPDGHTLFEIGSITKLFTAATLAALVERGEVKLDDPVSRYLPATVASPRKNNREITLVDLATQTSGLPRLPDNLLANADPLNPYANYRVADLYRALGTTKLQSEPGTTYLYSNFGFGLLGHLLALKTGKPYESLVEETICAPLGMASTSCALSPTQRSWLATGHDRKGNGVPNWDQDVMAPAGALKSDADDLLNFIEANLQESDSGLARALALARQTHFQRSGGDVGLGWQIHRSVERQTVLWHNGGTGGYVSFLGLDPESKIGVVLLSSYGDAMAGDNSVDKIGLEILRVGSKVSLAGP